MLFNDAVGDRLYAFVCLDYTQFWAGRDMEDKNQSLHMPWGFQEVESPIFQDSRHMKVVRLSALRIGCLYPPGKYFWYSFLLEAESTPGPQCGRKNYVNEKFQWHHRWSKPRPSGLYVHALTNYTTVCHKVEGTDREIICTSLAFAWRDSKKSQ